MDQTRTFLAFGALFALIGVALGAFGAHWLQSRVSSSDLDTFEIGVRYQMYHALALLAVAWIGTRAPSAAVQWSGWLFVAGILVFSGSLYVLVLSGARWLGAVTPIGGVAFLAGWATLLWSILRG